MFVAHSSGIEYRSLRAPDSLPMLPCSGAQVHPTTMNCGLDLLLAFQQLCHLQQIFWLYPCVRLKIMLRGFRSPQLNQHVCRESGLSHVAPEQGLSDVLSVPFSDDPVDVPRMTTPAIGGSSPAHMYLTYIGVQSGTVWSSMRGCKDGKRFVQR